MGENRLSSLLELLPEDPEVMVGMSTHHVPCTMASSHPHGWAAQTPPPCFSQCPESGSEGGGLS